MYAIRSYYGAVAPVVNGSVVPAFVAHQQTVVPDLVGVAVQDGAQYYGRYFAAAARAVTVLGELDLRITSYNVCYTKLLRINCSFKIFLSVC